MVKSKIFLCRLIAIDTLIAFDGVITSAADLQLRLISLIEQFNKALLVENHDETESEALCQFLCCYFDQRLTDNERGDLLHWQRYSLEPHFYGYSESRQDTALSSRLKPLLSSGNEVMFSYAWKLLKLLRQTEGQSETLVALRTAYRERHFSHRRVSQPTKQTEFFNTQHECAGTAKIMVLIIGPFARKWFRQFDLFSNDEGQIVWALADHAHTVMDRIAHIKMHHPEMAVQTYFPLLADGFENSSIMIEQMMAWLHAFKSIQLSEPLPCFLGLYTRLSQQRDAHNPDKAIWTGQLAPAANYDIKLESRLIDLIGELEANDSGDDLYAIQRHALGSTLVTWLAEQRIMSMLQNLFDSTSLKLAGVTLADYGMGFTRHGAWSIWLAEKCAILPGLSAAITLPPLPEIILPLSKSPRPESITSRVTPVNVPYSPGKSGWQKSALPLGLIAFLTVGVACYVKLKTDPAFHLLSQITLPESMLQKDQPRDPPTFFTPADIPLFQQGSSRLMPDSEKVLMEVAAKMKEAPSQTYLIIGHTDSSGTSVINNALSVERANVIRNWLAEKSGLPVSHFIVTGAGNSRPIASNDSPEGRALNRRVEIIPLHIQSQ
ncbi:OmpA family protein [Pantoea agglomerans]|nr:OmpA family protein [Pantoea agglomerans]